MNRQIWKRQLDRTASTLVLVPLLAAMPFGAVAQVSSFPPQVAQANPQVRFDIPAQPLNSALLVFGQQSGRQISAEAGLVRGLSTQGVRGTMTVDEALRRLLTGTDLTFRGTAGATITLQRADQVGADPNTIQLDPVQVQGYPVPPQAMIDNLPPPYAGGQVATGGQLGLLGNRPVMDTPFNQSNYTAKKAQDQQAKTVRDALIDDPSVRSVIGDGAPGGDSIRIRGFDVDAQANSYGGIYGIIPRYSVMAELAERIEVLKGPSAMLNGLPPSGAIGGTVNIVPKRAPNEGLTQFTANYVSAGQFGGHVDVARRLGPDKQFGVRFNGVFRAGQTDVQWNTDQRALGLLGLDFRGERVRLSGDFGYQSQYIGGVVGYLALADGVPLPWAPNARSNAGGQPWTYSERKDLFGVVRGEVDLTERVTAYAAFGAHDSRLAGMYPSVVRITNVNGAATSVGLQDRRDYYTYLTGQAGLRALVDTGPIGHEFAFTAMTLAQEYGVGSASGAPAYTTNIYNPTVVPRPTFSMPVSAANKTSTAGQSSLALADTLSAADKRIQLTVGARLQQVTAANFNPTSGAEINSYNESALSPSVALVFKPWQNVSLYGNWIQGLQQGIVVGPAFANAGEVFPPYKSTQYEMGIKVDWGKVSTTASLFQISQPSILTNVATNTQYLGGEQRNQGLEFNVFGEPMEGVRLLGGAMFLSPVLTKTQGGLTDGWIAPMTPQFTLNVAGEWDLPFVRGLTLNGRAIYTASQYIDTAWPRRSMPEWTRFDVGVRYTFENPGAKGKLLVARFNVENVFDANYWEGGFGAFAMHLGAPRTFRLSLTADF